MDIKCPLTGIKLLRWRSRNYRLNTERFGIVRKGEYGSGNDLSFKEFESGLFVKVPLPFNVILSEVE